MVVGFVFSPEPADPAVLEDLPGYALKMDIDEVTARGEGNPGGVNEELPDDWAADRTRLLCPYPEAAHYEEGDPEDAASFSCRQGSG